MSLNETDVAPWEEEQEAPESYEEFEEFEESSEEESLVTPEKEALIDEIANEYVGFWNILVSKTNWEKGKVIHSWRTKLMEAQAPKRLYTDEALAQRIGNVSPQHVGRLRRVYERFGSEAPLPNLYWSHYQAALDWDDADEWLARASEEKLSVAQTRVARWEKNGAKLETKPKDSDIVVEEVDGDVNPYDDSNVRVTSDGSVIVSSENEPEEKPKKEKKKAKKTDDPLGEFAGEDEPWQRADAPQTYATADTLNAIKALDPLPEDLSDAFQALQVAVLSRKVANWPDVQPILVAAYLSEYKKLLVSVD
ncbi:MAG: hypothetical protein Q4G03_11105 [Planctomycetia bacterium]|nr:hypothetical protein [Planctomycetia bacterium]